ncbi:hypothetical protein GUITHDRAFT_113943 [Guillardia theta CCMP2712]|uniref:Uncharacterized protein n=1 Tax=Guillardia theta (strain CCMP2712) TaxID=905079 RepID=L1IUL3_GUITC|nr:hypothetical protein GUITHDRAFT_113943 [Guillardia theta CCMP2712]EKX39951.1 hypothetical protein GUITHDRAFT_113943 [Guillardia theta CCMP2712]|eukprot:XP_005826931.1 hypothetical protein GUITHDRAFT_113943 [Guillardia theta CCMP2712]
MHNQKGPSKPSPRPWLRPSNEEKWAEYRNSGQLKAGDFVPSPSHQSSPDARQRIAELENDAPSPNKSSAKKSSKISSPPTVNSSSRTTIIKFDVDEPPLAIEGNNSGPEATKKHEEELEKERKLKEQAIAELQVARELAAKAMKMAEQASDASSPSDTRLIENNRKLQSSLQKMFKGWQQICSKILTKAAEFHYSWKEAEAEMDKILKACESPRKDSSVIKRSFERLRMLNERSMEKIQVDDNELAGLVNGLQRWDETARGLL